MPKDEELEARKQSAPAASSAEHEGDEDEAHEGGDVADRNRMQAGALLGLHGQKGGDVSEADDWWNVDAPRHRAIEPVPMAPAAPNAVEARIMLPGTRQRRGAQAPTPFVPHAQIVAQQKAEQAERFKESAAIAAADRAPKHRRGAIISSAPALAPASHHRRAAPVLAAPTQEDANGARNMARMRGAQQNIVGQGGQIQSGFGGHSGGRRNLPTVAASAAPASRDEKGIAHHAEGSLASENLIRTMNRRQHDGVRAELAGLDTGREADSQGDRRYLGADDVAADTRSIIEDPRYEKLYGIDRAADKRSGAGGAVKNKLEGFTDGLKQWYAGPDRAKKAGAYAARKVVGKVPFGSAVMSGASAYKEHERAKVDRAVAEDASKDTLTRSAAHGLGETHEGEKRKQIVNAVVGTVKSTVSLATGGAAEFIPGHEHAAEAGGSLIHRMVGKGEKAVHKALTEDQILKSAGTKAATKAGQVGGTKLYNELADEPQEEPVDDLGRPTNTPKALRQAAIAPVPAGSKEAVTSATDESNEAATRMFMADGKAGAGLLNHLNAQYAKPKNLTDELAEMRKFDNQKHDSTKSKLGFGDTEVSREHTLKPSRVARQIRGEAARQRQIERVGPETLAKLSQNEKLGWYESGAGTDVHVPEAAAPAAKKEASEDESEG